MGQSSGDRGGSRDALRLGCVFEQAIGHVTFRANLEARMADWRDVAAEWHALPYHSEGRWPPRRLNWTLRSGLMARSALRGTDYDALLFHTHLPALLCPDHLRRTPTLLSMDATPMQNARLGIYVGGSQRWPLLKRLTASWSTRILQGAFRIVAWSDWVRRSLVTEYGLDPSRIEVIAPGIDVARWDGRFSEPRVRHAGARGPARILFVGGDLRAKGGELLLDCFRRSWRGRAELHLVTHTQLPPEEGVIGHHGLTPNSAELMRLFREADLFVLPTLGDTFAQVILEAMASGLPVVASEVGAIPELVTPGETGYLVAPGDVEGLSAAVERLLADGGLREQMGYAGWRRAREGFDIARNGRRILDLAHRAREEWR